MEFGSLIFLGGNKIQGSGAGSLRHVEKPKTWDLLRTTGFTVAILKRGCAGPGVVPEGHGPQILLFAAFCVFHFCNFLSTRS